MPSSNATDGSHASNSLINICRATFENFRSDYVKQEGHEMKYALIADLGTYYRGFFIAVFGEEEFHPEHEEMDSITIDSSTYEVIGTIVGGQVNFSCSEDKLKPFFTKTGKAMLLPARVTDLIKERKIQALDALGEHRGAERKEAKWEKKKRQKREQEQAASASASATANQHPDSDELDDDEKAQKKREKRRAKEKRQKERRKEEAEIKKLAEEEKIEQLKEQVRSQLQTEGKADWDIKVFDTATEEGRENIRKAQESGEGPIFPVRMENLD